jgi:hypothetical protein
LRPPILRHMTSMVISEEGKATAVATGDPSAISKYVLISCGADNGVE